FGVELQLPPELFEGLDGDALLARRTAVVAAVADVVHGRAEHPVLRLAPDLRWDARLGLALLAFVVGPALPALPGDRRAEEGSELVDPGGLEGLADALELQVLPAPGAHRR